MALVASLAAPATAAAAPFVSVDATLKRDGDGAVVIARIAWNQDAAAYMSVGDLRLVAVSEHGHHPKLLDTDTDQNLDADATQRTVLKVKDADADAIAAGNRLVLTASQHPPVSQGTRTSKTYVTVEELQPFGSQQDRIGRRDCSDVAIEAGARLNECDLTGAFLERALVSVRQPVATRMLLGDLTGANLRGADLTGLSLAGGRLNGAEAEDAVLDNLSLAGAEATGLDAEGATSDRAQGTAGANIFDAKLIEADFRGAVLNGVSLNHSRLDGADFRGATWNAMQADTASFRGADLRGLKGVGESVYFADFTDAKLGGAPLSAADLEWATLCHTQMPGAALDNLADRDCRAQVDPGPKPAPRPFVVVDAKLGRTPGQATIKGTITWSAGALAAGMSAGDVRALAIDGSTGVPTTVGSLSIPKGLTPTTAFEATIEKREQPEQFEALNKGNRVVLTATQHPPLPSSRGGLTSGSYVGVDTLQPGPGRGRVGSRDCSGLLLSARTPAPGGYDFCDLPGAVLTQAGLSGPMREADLSGAELGAAGISGIVFDGASLAGADAAGDGLEGVSMIAASAPGLSLPKTPLRRARMRAANLDGANFAGARINDTTFAASSLRRATFTGATLTKVDLGYAGLDDAKLDRVDAGSPGSADGHSSLFLADLTDATLADSEWNDDESGERPWLWSTLCDTVMPADAGISGDRDCPR